MVNPFKELKNQYKAQKVMEAGWEEIDGPMACQTFGCKLTANEGLYSKEAKVLTWKCPEGHLSKMENFEA